MRDEELDCFLSYSGGLDSAFVLYLLLKKGRKVLVHHVRLTDKKGRQQNEYKAVRDTLRWLKSQNLPGDFIYKESKLDTSDHETWPRDHFIWCWFLGCLLKLKKYQHINEVATGSHLNSFNTGETSLAHLKEVRTLYGLVFPLLADRNVKFINPIGKMTKKTIIEKCPPELRELTWSCRKPRSGKPCHACHTCRQIDRADKGVETQPLDFKNYRFEE